MTWDSDLYPKSAAAERVGLTESHLSRALAQPHVANFFDQRTRRALDQGKIIAAGRLVELLHAHSDPYPGVTYSQRRACVVAEADKLIFWF